VAAAQATADAAQVTNAANTASIGFLTSTSAANRAAIDYLTSTSATHTADIEAAGVTNAEQEAVIAAVTNGVMIGIPEPPRGAIGIVLIGQSNAQGFPGGTNRLPVAMHAPGLTGAYVAASCQYSTVIPETWSYATNAMFINSSTNATTWGVELPLANALQSAGYTPFIYKSAVGGADSSAFIGPGATYWPLVTGAYATAAATWTNAPVPSIVIYMRGETGSDSQTQAQSYGERTNVWAQLKTLYGNTNLHWISTGLPGVYYTNAAGVAVEAGARQLDSESDMAWFVETHDIVAGHYNQDQMLEVSSRILAVIGKILADKRSTVAEHKQVLAADNVIADTVEARDIRYQGRPLPEAVDVLIDIGSTNASSALRSAIDHGLASSTNWPSPSQTNSIAYWYPFETPTMSSFSVWSNAADTSRQFLPQGSMSNSTWYTDATPGVGGYYSFPETATNYLSRGLDTRLMTSSWTTCFWYRRQYDNSQGGPRQDYLVTHPGTNAGATISIWTRQYYNNNDALATYPAVQVCDATSNTVFVTATAASDALVSNVWTHIAARVDLPNNELALFVNGALAGTTNVATLTKIGNLSGGLRIGGGAGAYNAGGDIAHWEMWTRALPSNEIFARAKAAPLATDWLEVVQTRAAVSSLEAASAAVQTTQTLVKANAAAATNALVGAIAMTGKFVRVGTALSYVEGGVTNQLDADVTTP
jgi:hypothetical protein